MTNELLDFLRAQLDEDERVAQEASGDAWVTGASAGYEYSRPGDVYAIAHDGTPARIAQGTRCGPDISAEQSSEHIARHDPARVLAEVEAKQRILDEHHPTVYGDGSRPDCYCCSDKRGDDVERYPCLTVRLLALPYADRPGYQEAWRP